MSDAATNPDQGRFFDLTVAADKMIGIAVDGGTPTRMHLIDTADGGRYYVMGGMPTPYPATFELTFAHTSEEMSFPGDGAPRARLAFKNPQLADQCAAIPRETSIVLGGMLWATGQQFFVLTDGTLIDDMAKPINPKGLYATFNFISEQVMQGYGFSDRQIDVVRGNMDLTCFLMTNEAGKWSNSLRVQDSIRPELKFVGQPYVNGL